MVYEEYIYIYIIISDLTMVYGRYNELVHGVYKPTNITGGYGVPYMVQSLGDIRI
jgi:hypothetical protein